MKYQFTFKMFHLLWDPLQLTGLQSSIARGRIEYWNKHYKDKYHLDYVESMDQDNDDFYGAIIGDEKHITYFLLQL